MDLSRVTRFEVVDHSTEAHQNGSFGRILVRYGVSAQLSLQDDGCTLKIFLGDGPKDTETVSLEMAEGLKGELFPVQMFGLCDRDEPHEAHLYAFDVLEANKLNASCPGQYAVCRNCDDRKCMACVCREIHDYCVHDCPFCCAE